MQRKMVALRCLVFALALSTGEWMLAQGTRTRTRPIQLHPGPLMDVALKPAVLKELGIESDSAKIEEITKLQDALKHELVSMLRNVERKDRRKQSHEIERKLEAKYNAELKKLLTPQQFERLQQINWQREGSLALEHAEVVKALDITTEQQEKLAALGRETWNQEVMIMNPGDTPGRLDKDIRAKLSALRAEREKKANAILSKTQQDKFAKLKGKPFDVALLRTKPALRAGETGLVIDIKESGIQVSVNGGLSVSVFAGYGPVKEEVRVDPGDHRLVITSLAGPRQFATKESFSLQKGQKRNLVVWIVGKDVIAKLDNQLLTLAPPTGRAKGKIK
jgi:hypothetical protein